MEAPSTEMQANKSERFRFVHWKAKCNSLRLQESFTPFSIDVHAAEQNGQKSGVERKDENQPINPSEHSKMDIETECEQTETALPNIPTTSNLDDRCIRESYGSGSSNEQQKIRFPSIASREIEMPELEFQGIICNQSSTQPFQIPSSGEQSLQIANQIRQYNSGFQCRSMECRIKSQEVANENIFICSEQSHSDKSPALSRDDECQSGCSIQSRRRRRLFHKRRRVKRNHGNPQSQNNYGCVVNE